MEVTKNHGSLTGSIHRAWMDTRAFLSMNNTESILKEVQRGEKSAIED